MADKPVWTIEEVIARLTRWNGALAFKEVAYAFYEQRPNHRAGDPLYTGFFAFDAEQREAVKAALALVSEIVPLTFHPTPDDGRQPGAASPKIAFGQSSSAPNFFTASTELDIADRPPFPDHQTIHGAEIYLNVNRMPGGYEPGGRNFYVLIHEILHAIGLPHPGEYNRGPDEPILYSRHAEHHQDSLQYTLMSYFSEAETGAFHGGNFASTLLLHDIAALQAIYGANSSTRATNSVYGFNSNLTGPYSFSAASRPVIAIWDGGGRDRLDLSGFGVAQVIDLNPGHFSNVAGLTANLSIGYGVVIEEAIGGQGDDQITGNAADNLLVGLKGDDAIDGGAGYDRAGFEGGVADHQWIYGEGGWRISGPSGVDQCRNIEALVFSDGAILLQDDQQTRLEDVVATALKNVLRLEALSSQGGGHAFEWSHAISRGVMNAADMAKAAAAAAGATTSVATLSYQFFTHRTPTAEGLDYLVAPDGPNVRSLTSSYFQGFNLENRYINFAVNLGRDGEGSQDFARTYGALSLTEAFSKAYSEIFGAPPAQEKVQALLLAPIGAEGMTRNTYFRALGETELGAKAAMVGWLLAEAQKAQLGVYAKANTAYLADLADGAPMNIDLVGVYGRPEDIYAG